MSQTTDSRPDNWPAPWGRSAGAGTTPGQDATQPIESTQPVAPEQAPVAEHTPAPEQPPATPQSYPQPGRQGSPSGYPGTGYASGYPYATGPGDTGSQGPGSGHTGYPPQPAAGDVGPARQPRRPGWLGVAGVGLGAALVSSLLTAGLVNHDGSAPADSTSSTGSSAPSAASGGSSAAGSAQQVAPVPVSGNAAAPNWTAVAAAVEPSVVAVKVAGQGGSGEGSGVLLDPKGDVLTNNHVVADASNGGSIQVVLADGRGYEAGVVGTDAQTDLAVIKIKNPPSGLKPAVLGDSGQVKVGDPVMAVGNPLGLSDTVTTGIVSAVDRPVTTGASQDQLGTGSSSTVFTNAIQTDAAINPGNSGGALLDSHGRLIGINSSIASLGSSGGGSQSGNIGLGFAIPVNEAKDVADQLLASGKVAHAYLGVSLQDGTVTLNGATRQTAAISQVAANAPAAKAGLKVGDQVIAVDGDRVNGSDSLIAQVRERRPGTEITLTVVRNGSSQDVRLTMGTRPND